MKALATFLALGLSFGAGAVAAAAAPPATSSSNAALHGTWRNALDSVDVRIEDCGVSVCGVVIAATAEAIADARDSGYPHLVGMQLLRNYRAGGRGRWVGTVLVPDLGRSFSSHIELIDAGHARVAGCLWHQYFCQSQLWRRL